MQLHRKVEEERLRLRELLAMGIGGMIGGGSFPYLGSPLH